MPTLSSPRLTPGWVASQNIVFQSPTFPFPGRRTEEYDLSDRQSADASDRAVDSRRVLVRVIISSIPEGLGFKIRAKDRIGPAKTANRVDLAPHPCSLLMLSRTRK